MTNSILDHQLYLTLTSEITRLVDCVTKLNEKVFELEKEVKEIKSNQELITKGTN